MELKMALMAALFLIITPFIIFFMLIFVILGYIEEALTGDIKIFA